MGLTVVEKILLAAHGLEEIGQSPFTAEQLIVKAWEMDRDLFGLQGYASRYPDSNRVLTNIMGRKGLAGRGWIERVAEKKYQLTAAGARAALKLGQSDTRGPGYAGALARKEIGVVVRMLESTAFAKSRNGENDIIFRDACSFWGISNYSNAKTLHDRFIEIRDVLKELDKAIKEAPTHEIALPERKIVVDAKTVTDLRDAHEVLQRTFFNELKVISARS
jgi:hypothetical protein